MLIDSTGTLSLLIISVVPSAIAEFVGGCSITAGDNIGVCVLDGTSIVIRCDVVGAKADVAVYVASCDNVPEFVPGKVVCEATIEAITLSAEVADCEAEAVLVPVEVTDCVEEPVFDITDEDEALPLMD